MYLVINGYKAVEWLLNKLNAKTYRLSTQWAECTNLDSHSVGSVQTAINWSLSGLSAQNYIVTQ